MESVGDEKSIRARFSELKFADGQAAPGFTGVWHRAQSRSLKPRRAFNVSFAVATALMICAMASLAIWSKYSRPSAKAFATVSPNAALAPRTKEPSNLAATFEPPKYRPTVKARATKLASQRQMQEIAANQQLTEEAKALNNWQSPTSELLTSPSDGLFKSLPQLNENANELKSFLPNRANDKEK